MAIRKRSDPIAFPIHLSREVERLFDEMIHRPWGFSRELRGWNPSVDLSETPTAFILEADLPGVKPEDVRVSVEDGDLVLEGSRHIEATRSEGRFHMMERSSGYFFRRMRLPESVDQEAIQAEFRDGVFRVILPKLQSRKDDRT